MTTPPASGPVTEAIRVMRACDPAFDDSETVRALRRALARRIEGDIAVLDVLGGDPDLEPSLGASEPFTAGPAMDWTYGSGDDREDDAGDNREEENEHGADEDRGEPSLCGLEVGPGDSWDREGGDIQDEPHDREEDCDEDERGLPSARYNPAHEIRKRKLVINARLDLAAVRRRRAAARHA